MQETLDPANAPRITDATVAILQSKWYPDMVGRMAQKCADILEDKGATVFEHTVPGCLELPYAANELIQGPGVLDAVICLGIVLKGETRHFDMIVDACSRGLGDVARATRVPIINEVIPVEDIAHAEARTADDRFNKGIEAAIAAIEIIDWRRRNHLTQ